MIAINVNGTFKGFKVRKVNKREGKAETQSKTQTHTKFKISQHMHDGTANKKKQVFMLPIPYVDAGGGAQDGVWTTLFRKVKYLKFPLAAILSLAFGVGQVVGYGLKKNAEVDAATSYSVPEYSLVHQSIGNESVFGSFG